ncbi:MAG: SAM-dependent methyltransferase [Steroidobacteraceae bacterium]
MGFSMPAEAHDDETRREALAREALAESIRAAGGWLDFERAMDLLLYAPGWGYYTGGARKFGQGGDFVTAPEISPLFGQCIAAAIAPVLAATEGDVLEIGAGSGVLAVDLLTELAVLGALPRRYRILELSTELRERQRERFESLPAELKSRIEFLHEPPREAWRGALVANEVLDALPVQRFVTRDGQVFTRGASLAADGSPEWAERLASAAHADEVRRLFGEAALPEDYHSEWCPRLGAWLRAVTDKLERGIALFADYGLPRHEYYHPTRERGTLRCHHRHRAHDDPWVHLATQDITAWVDFTRVAEAADEAGLDVLGFTSQAAFLLATGIEARVASVTDVRARARLAHEARRLLMPDEMGEVFKLIALGRGVDEPPGFHLRDLRNRL